MRLIGGVKMCQKKPSTIFLWNGNISFYGLKFSIFILDEKLIIFRLIHWYLTFQNNQPLGSLIGGDTNIPTCPNYKKLCLKYSTLHILRSQIEERWRYNVELFLIWYTTSFTVLNACKSLKRQGKGHLSPTPRNNFYDTERICPFVLGLGNWYTIFNKYCKKTIDLCYVNLLTLFGY
jgi:hypothetical protein